MSVQCKKCGYIRQSSDVAPETECPKCGAIYAKVEEYLRKQQLLHQQKLIAEQQSQELRQKQAAAAHAQWLSRQLICTDCGHLGTPKTITRGSFVIEVILWICFLIPGMIYTAWRLTSKYKACPQCKHDSMIPASSPKGRKILRELETNG